MSRNHNFCFPIRDLENDRVKLTPFLVCAFLNRFRIAPQKPFLDSWPYLMLHAHTNQPNFHNGQPSKHAAAFFAATVSHPELYAHMPMGPFDTQSDFVSQFLDGVSGPNPGWLTYAVLDKTRRASPSTSTSSTSSTSAGNVSDETDSTGKGEGEGEDDYQLAGMMSFMNTSPVHLSTEIGCIVILPAFQRTHVTSNAVGLMLEYAFAPSTTSPSHTSSPSPCPSAGPHEGGGMSLRRVQWNTSTQNKASLRVAERFGFRQEGVLRWYMVFKGGAKRHKVGNGRVLPSGSEEGDLGRDTVVLGLCWDDYWEGGAREKVLGAMARRG